MADVSSAYIQSAIFGGNARLTRQQFLDRVQTAITNLTNLGDADSLARAAILRGLTAPQGGDPAGRPLSMVDRVDAADGARDGYVTWAGFNTNVIGNAAGAAAGDLEQADVTAANVQGLALPAPIAATLPDNENITHIITQIGVANGNAGHVTPAQLTAFINNDPGLPAALQPLRAGMPADTLDALRAIVSSNSGPLINNDGNNAQISLAEIAQALPPGSPAGTPVTADHIEAFITRQLQPHLTGFGHRVARSNEANGARVPLVRIAGQDYSVVGNAPGRNVGVHTHPTHGTYFLSLTNDGHFDVSTITHHPGTANPYRVTIVRYDFDALQQYLLTRNIFLTLPGTNDTFTTAPLVNGVPANATRYNLTTNAGQQAFFNNVFIPLMTQNGTPRGSAANPGGVAPLPGWGGRPAIQAFTTENLLGFQANPPGGVTAITPNNGFGVYRPTP